ncbi:MAG TPA: hypothetical protein VF053_09555 [Streptosporangiales bacterium]
MTAGIFGAVRKSVAPEGNVLHYAANGNIARDGTYAPARLGFDLADVRTPAQVASLPDGVRALVYLGTCDGVTASFEATVRSFADDSRVFGFYLADMPDPARCAPADLRAESDYIHAHVPGARTFVLEQNLASSQWPRFGYGPANTGIDLYGIAPYPCRSELAGCDLAMIGRYVTAARTAGIPESAMVPVYQAFGGGVWVDDGGGSYLLPTAGQATAIIRRWRSLVPEPVFDYVYSWGSQRGDVALCTAPAALQAVFADNNR